MDYQTRYRQMLADIERLVDITNKRSVLILLQHTHPDDTEPCIPPVRESISNIIGFVSLGDGKYLPYIIEHAVGIIDTIMIDVDTKRDNSEQIRLIATQMALERGISVAYYSDYTTWVTSALALMLEIENQTKPLPPSQRKRLIIGRNILATKMVMEMINRGMDVYLYDREYPVPIFPTAGGEIEIRSSYIHLVDNLASVQPNILVGCELQKNTPFLDDLAPIRYDLIYDIGTHNFTRDFISQQRECGAQVYRSDDRAGISGAVVSLMETGELVKARLGKTSIGGINIVSGGYVGDMGDIVVDNYSDAHTVLGVANGDGTFKHLPTEEDLRNIEKIKTLL